MNRMFYQRVKPICSRVARDRAIVGVVIGAVFYLLLGFALAEQRELKTESTDKIDAVLVLDGSGSMLVTDPLRLRDEGAKLFTQFLKTGDRLAIVGFAETARVIRPLSDYDPAQAEEIAKNIAEVGNSGQYTNILEGVKLARSLLENSAREGAAQSVVLLSDGKMDPDPSAGTSAALTEDLIDNYLPSFKQKEIKLYTLDFSEEADKDLLKEMAAATDGINWFTPNADKIHESFADLFLAVKKPQVVPLTKKGFKIDSDVQEATFYINREGSQGEITLISPANSRITAAATEPNIKWFSGQKFDVVTINQPSPGDWQLEGVSTNDGFATVLTNIKLVTDWPANTNAGEKALLQARLYESEKPIALPEMSDVVKYAFQITPTDKVSEPIIREFLFDDGTHGDKIAKDGIFSSDIKIEEAGEYKLRILARSPTFERNQQIPFRVKPELITLQVVSVDEANLSIGGHGEEGHGEEGHGEHKGGGLKDYLHVELDTEALSFKRVEVKLFAVDEHKSRYEIPLSQSKDNKLKYDTPVSVLPKDGEYKIQATLSAEGKKKDIKVSSRALTYVKAAPVEGEPTPETQIIVTHEEVPQTAPSPVLYIILVTLVNGALGGVVFMLLKKITSGDAEEAPEFPGIVEIRAAIDQLQAKVALADVDLTLPIFTDPNFQLTPLWKQGGPSTTLTQVAKPAAPEPQKEEKVEAEAEEASTDATEEEVPAEEEAPAEEEGGES